jgi:CubicO group peptidase (beta-lactamase class C family)
VTASVSHSALDKLWDVQDAHVASGRIPGYVAAIRIAGQTHVHAGGRRAMEPDAPPMDDQTLFRIASISKPIAGALALTCIHDGVLTLDDPIGRWLPELAHPRVLLTPDGPLDRTTEATRPVTVRHLLTMTSGWGAVMQSTPLQTTMIEEGLFPSSMPPALTRDEYLARVAALPLAFQPGEGWLYDTGINLLGILLARATGTPLPELLAERITGPLDMTSTSFWTSEPDRLATAYRPGPQGLDTLDPPDGVYSRPRDFERLGGGLLSTGSDVLRFFTALADGGSPVLTPDEVALMTTPALTDEQLRDAEPIVGPGASWGLATGVDTASAFPWMTPGRWGWTGGSGTTAYVDPSRDLVAILLTQREMTGPRDGFEDFWAGAAALAS